MISPSFNRRAFLRAGGVALALPILESTSLATVEPMPVRMVNVCATLGLYAESWFPKTAGADYETSEYLAHLDRYRDRLTLFSGLAHANQVGRQAHNSEITWLTSAEQFGLDGFQNTISLDQAAANHLGYVTRFPSIVLGTNRPQSQSYTRGGVMIPAETSPSKLFSQLFLDGDATTIAKESKRLSDGGSILDHLKTETSALIPKASVADRAKLDSFFEALRSAERDLVEIQAWQRRPKPKVSTGIPSDVDSSADIVGRIRAMLNLVPLILETDSSRVVSLMIQDHGITPSIPEISMDQHNLSHHGQDPDKIKQLRKVENLIVESFAKFIATLAERNDKGKSLLDSTVIFFGSNLGNANSHSAKDLPILVAGGPLPHGKHHVFKGESKPPLSNLFVTLLHTMGLEIDKFGHSNGALTWS